MAGLDRRLERLERAHPPLSQRAAVLSAFLRDFDWEGYAHAWWEWYTAAGGDIRHMLSQLAGLSSGWEASAYGGA